MNGFQLETADLCDGYGFIRHCGSLRSIRNSDISNHAHILKIIFHDFSGQCCRSGLSVCSGDCNQSAFAKEYASSISPQMQTFCARIRSTTGRSVGTPGLKTATSNARSCSSVNSPKAPAFLSVSVPFHITFLHPDLCFHHREQFQFFYPITVLTQQCRSFRLPQPEPFSFKFHYDQPPSLRIITIIRYLLLQFKVRQYVFENFLCHRSRNGTAIINAGRVPYDHKYQNFRIIRRCKPQKRGDVLMCGTGQGL